MDAFDTNRKGYRFKEELTAKLFAMSFDHKMDISIEKCVPDGEAQTGWMVFIRARSVSDELIVSKAYERIADCYKIDSTGGSDHDH